MELPSILTDRRILACQIHVILCPMILDIFSLLEEFMCSPCHVNSFLVRFMSIILT